MEKNYKCKVSLFSVNSSGGAGPIREVTHSRREIINIARESAGRAGTSLEEFEGIATVDTEDGGWEYARELSDEEEFNTALEYLRHDGHIFEVVEEL